ncbi:unnamed protein product, partial [Timema podura]|nr:unnamed protein product [Timema podura]
MVTSLAKSRRDGIYKRDFTRSLPHFVPYELLNKKFRAAQKQLDREVSHVQAAALELERGLHGESVKAGDISRLLGGMVERLQVLKRK